MSAIERRSRVTRALARRSVGLALTVIVLVSVPFAEAATCNASTPGLAFGTYDVFAPGATNGSATLTVACTIGATDTGNTPVAYVISLSAGSSASYAQRQMKSGANALGYNLYTSNAYAVVWGDGTGSTATVSGSMSVNPGHPTASNNHTVYGRVPALQDAAVASDYRDNVTVTVTF